MLPYSFSGPACNSNVHGSMQYPSSARYAEGDWNAGIGQHPNFGRYPDGGQRENDSPHQCDRRNQGDNRYIDHHWRPCQQVIPAPHQQVHQAPRMMHRKRHRKHRPVPVLIVSSSNGDDESEQEIKNTDRRNKDEFPQKPSEEDRIIALAEEMYKKKIAEDEQRKADEKERKEKLLKEENEKKEFYEAQKHKALADQRAAIQKEAEDKEKAMKAELERQARAKTDEQELMQRTAAAVRESEKNTAADRMRAYQEKEEADRIEAARLEAEVEQRAEKKYEERKKQEADDLEAAEKENQEREHTEDMKTLLLEMKKYLSMMEKKALRNQASTKDPRAKSTRKNAGPPGEMTEGSGKSEVGLARIKELFAKLSKSYDLGDEAAFLEEEAVSESHIETEPLHVGDSGSLGDSKGTVGQKKDARSPKKGKREGKWPRKIRGKGNHGEDIDGCDNKNGRRERRSRALTALGWLAGESYQLRKKHM